MSAGQSGISLMHPWQLVAHREISAKLRDRTFIGSTVFMLVLVLGAVIIPALLIGHGGPDRIAVLDDTGVRVVERADVTNGGATFKVARVTDEAEAERLVKAGKVKAALVPGDNGYVVLGDDRVEMSVQAKLREAVVNVGMEQNAAGAGLNAQRLRANTQLQERLLNAGPLPDLVSDFVNVGLALVFYMTALGFGMMIAQSVVREKESRVVEILAAAVPIRALLWGKVIGSTALALGQIVVIAAASLIGLLVTGQADVLTVVAPVAGWFVVFFVLGFVALAGLWAVAGSLAARQDDLGSTTLPGQMILMIPFFFSVLAGDQAKAVASFVPIASSMAMPGRMLTRDVAVWQPLLAIAILLVTTVLIVRVGARLYERTLLQTGCRLGYREAMSFKWI